MGLMARLLGRNVEERTAFDSAASTQWPRPWFGTLSQSGLYVTDASAQGLPAVGAVIRAPAEVIASLPFIVYENGDDRARAETAWQWGLLHEKPSEYCDSYRFFYDLALSLEATQNAFVLKAATPSEVVELTVLNPHQVRATRAADGTPEYEYWTEDGKRVPIPTRMMLHVRGSTLTPGGLNGVSLIAQHRDAIGAAQAIQVFEGDFFRNNAQAPMYFTGAQNQQHALDMKALWDEAHAGGGNQWKPGFMWGQMDVKSIPISMQDALFIESKRLTIEDACRIWNWPKELVQLTGEQTTSNEEAWLARVLKMSVLPRIRRIERAFAADPDLFYGQPVFGEFLTAGLLRPDFVSEIRALKDAVQGGIMTPNEARRTQNLPPHPDGDELQFPVVGGGAVKDGAAPDSSPPNGNGSAARSLEELLAQ